MSREKVSRDRETKKEKSHRRKSKTNRICKEVVINLLKKLYFFLRLCFDTVVDYIFAMYWESTHQSLPDLDKKHAMLRKSAVALAKEIKNKELKSEELVTACIERIKLVNPVLNAVTDERYEDALKEAREVDKLIEAGLSEEDSKKPFLGVPFTAKESHAVKGMLHTLGILSRKHIRADEDAECVRLLRVAGAIPVAVTNVPEINKWQESRNNVFGQTNNPYHTGRTPGGSSGGEAALSAALACPIALCSDIGGSTRMPAFYCGLYALNPTAGHTSLKGSALRSGKDPTMASIGFLSRHCEDLIPLTKVVAADKAHLLDLDRQVHVKDLKFYYVESVNDLRVSPVCSDLKKAMKKVIYRLSSQAENTEQAPKPYYHEGFNHSFALWRHAMTKEADSFPKLLANNEGEVNGLVELAKKLVGASQFTLAAIFKCLDEQVLPPVPAAWADRLTQQLKDDLLETLGSDGVLLFPSAPAPAPYHCEAFLRPFNFAFWGVFNALKFPAAQVPLGLNADGLPLGLQVVAAPQHDALCVAVAEHLGAMFQGYVPPCRVPE
ncbi:fatty-acid amide hydrolase 2 [Bicyclus anynana]|uniref:Fatty-acid amide hydrolase 2 n=1 Tax=Bicyclus anynana TaxID=110368 RepID=A0ABM3LWM6_BICAN|nr:fatty-acid amide hydrolase 2 [Bicyclus anynana]XP_052743463.1 fatty-acid amide hydrolase 2 [Bicyclus anynana]XP_052743464.1 fatty-acid amide hydrolase 2 [Bicyclus anynana]XP_052743465.1 fatty-acid amide hydrolase 2 [Bicyclus anynana]